MGHRNNASIGVLLTHHGRGVAQCRDCCSRLLPCLGVDMTQQWSAAIEAATSVRSVPVPQRWLVRLPGQVLASCRALVIFVRF